MPINSLSIGGGFETASPHCFHRPFNKKKLPMNGCKKKTQEFRLTQNRETHYARMQKKRNLFFILSSEVYFPTFPLTQRVTHTNHPVGRLALCTRFSLNARKQGQTEKNIHSCRDGLKICFQFALNSHNEVIPIMAATKTQKEI